MLPGPLSTWERMVPAHGVGAHPGTPLTFYRRFPRSPLKPPVTCKGPAPSWRQTWAPSVTVVTQTQP